MSVSVASSDDKTSFWSSVTSEELVMSAPNRVGNKLWGTTVSGSHSLYMCLPSKVIPSRDLLEVPGSQFFLLYLRSHSRCFLAKEIWISCCGSGGKEAVLQEWLKTQTPATKESLWKVAFFHVFSKKPGSGSEAARGPGSMWVSLNYLRYFCFWEHWPSVA